MTQTLTVALGDRSYPIVIAENLLTDFDFSGFISGKKVAIVTNTTIAPLYLATLKNNLQQHAEVIDIILPDGERYKDWPTLQIIFDALISNHCDRKTTLVALGGGVIGDITGFAAACYQRGVPFIQVPTTLLSQVDSSVGGKTAINHPLAKNMIGAFYQPRLVLADLNTLNTLPARELAAGLGEIIKYGLITDADFFTWLEQNWQKLLQRDQAALSTAIYRACAIKAAIVAQDETENAMRAWLNLGHTFGHAIEATQGYGTWLHGEAVGVGMLLALRFSERRFGLDHQYSQRLEKLLQSAYLPTTLPLGLTAEHMLASMAHDKKVAAGQIRLVLLTDLAKTVVTADYQVADLMDFLRGELADAQENPFPPRPTTTFGTLAS
jgi:3-dehydroquinate synthase